MNFKKIQHVYSNDINSIEVDGNDFESLTREQQLSLAHKLLDVQIEGWNIFEVVGELLRIDPEKLNKACEGSCDLVGEYKFIMEDF